ncbi:MAG: hypothetical protein LBS18_06795 [Clostridiales bacterium]|nr:hypothetical protein [Clostridiales bacterium]
MIDIQFLARLSGACAVWVQLLSEWENGQKAVLKFYGCFQLSNTQKTRSLSGFSALASFLSVNFGAPEGI